MYFKHIMYCIVIENPYHSLGRQIQQTTNCEIDDIFLIFSEENRLWNLCNFFPKEKICMKCQILFFVKNKEKNISECCLLKILPSMLSVERS